MQIQWLEEKCFRSLSNGAGYDGAGRTCANRQDLKKLSEVAKFCVAFA